MEFISLCSSKCQTDCCNYNCLRNTKLEMRPEGEIVPNFLRTADLFTIKLAPDPSSERFPATVLTHANISHAFFSFSGNIVAAAAATLAPSNSTERKKKISPTILEVAKWAELEAMS
ncbi:hypothetical protein CTI12_AA363650 [Artemisia annua]|uniref:Uncharacterized protein n=1 Tax=Artemisia annua TaxID=35608 RepID=A0A2U1MMN1_ARTAN|nr:hypothetical protein CTI12_AA363650 [Artemisia annua]